MPVRVKESLLEILGQMLRPVLRLCLRHGVEIQAVTEIVKETMIQCAINELEARKDKVTVSRLSVMTGLHRRDVKRLYKEGSRIEDRRGLADRVMTLWEQTPDYLTVGGKPRALTYKGDGSEFNELVSLVSTDVNPATVLYELERMGSVSKSGSTVKCAQPITFFSDDPEQGLHLLALDLESVVDSAEENLFRPQKPKNLHLRTEFDNLFIKDIPKIRSWVLKEGAAFHRKVRTYLSKHDADLNPGVDKEGGGRMVVVACSWGENTQRSEADKE